MGTADLAQLKAVVPFQWCLPAEEAVRLTDLAFASASFLFICWNLCNVGGPMSYSQQTGNALGQQIEATQRSWTRRRLHWARALRNGQRDWRGGIERTHSATMEHRSHAGTVGSMRPPVLVWMHILFASVRVVVAHSDLAVVQIIFWRGQGGCRAGGQGLRHRSFVGRGRGGSSCGCGCGWVQEEGG